MNFMTKEDLQKQIDGIGLKNMRERAKSSQAKFAISSELGKGTKIQVVFENAESKKE